MKISQRVSKLLSRHYIQTEFSKGNNSVKNVGGVLVLVPYVFFNDALYMYLYQFFMKLSQRVSELLIGHDFQTEIFKEA